VNSAKPLLGTSFRGVRRTANWRHANWSGKVEQRLQVEPQSRVTMIEIVYNQDGRRELPVRRKKTTNVQGGRTLYRITESLAQPKGGNNEGKPLVTGKKKEGAYQCEPRTRPGQNEPPGGLTNTWARKKSDPKRRMLEAEEWWRWFHHLLKGPKHSRQVDKKYK